MPCGVIKPVLVNQDQWELRLVVREGVYRGGTGGESRPVGAEACQGRTELAFWSDVLS